MLTFDKLKIVSSLDSIEIFDLAWFEKKIKNGETASLRMSSRDPFALAVEINYEKREVVIEFTGKVLGPRYPELISIDTIRECFNRINDMGFCRIDVKKMMLSEVVKCDVTIDIPVPDIPTLNRYIRGHIKNYLSYVCRLQRNGNLILEKNVTGRKYKKRITIYDKQEQMMKSTEQIFAADNNLEGKYQGICRVEMNLNSQAAIRDALHISGTTLREVLQSDREPIRDFLSEVLKDDSTPNVQDSWKTYCRALVLKDCDFDLAKVEARIREYKSGGVSKALQPFRDIMETIDTEAGAWTKAKVLDSVSNNSRGTASEISEHSSV